MKRIFLSCVSSEFGAHRRKLANYLGALRDTPFEVRTQEDLQQGGFTLLEALADYISACDVVIHLVGKMAGARPSEGHEQALVEHLGEPASTPLPCRSYTQWEYDLARRSKRPTFVYLADSPGGPAALQQPEEDAAVQRAHVARLRESGQHWASFTTAQSLWLAVRHDLQIDPRLIVNNLDLKSIGHLFKGREPFLDQVRRAVGDVEHRGHQRLPAIRAEVTAAVVHGLGGVGKTRAAVEFAHRHGDDYTAVLFIRADSPQALQDNLAALCGPLVLNLAEQREQETEAKVGAALRWLSQHPGWFLIVDNVDSEAAARDVEALLARLEGRGVVLVTSRLGRWSGAVETLELDVLAEADAAAFLLDRTERRRRTTPDDAAEAASLAVELGQLALALEQAGAFIDTRRLAFAQYRAEWHTNHTRVLEWFDERLMHYPRSVATTWLTSFEQLDANARHLLRVCAWLAPDPIPESLLRADEAPPGAFEALVQLEAYSLATRSDAAEAPVFFIHRLVQDVTRQAAGDDAARGAHRGEALTWLAQAFAGDPQDVRVWPLLDSLAEHVGAVAAFTDDARPDPRVGSLLSLLGTLRYSKAEFGAAEPLLRRALAIDEAGSGPHRPEVARDLNNLATLFWATNRRAEAEPLLRRALAICEASYGPDHPDVAMGLNNLAVLLGETNRRAEAEPLLRRALAIDEASYGPDHPALAKDLNNLAALLRATNPSAEAASLERAGTVPVQDDTPAGRGKRTESKRLVVLGKPGSGKWFGVGGLEGGEEHRISWGRTTEEANAAIPGGAKPYEPQAASKRNSTLQMPTMARTEGRSRPPATRQEVPGDRVDRVHFSVTGPASARRGHAVVVSVWAHFGNQRANAVKRARESLLAREPFIVQTRGPARLERGTVLTVILRLAGLLVGRSEDTILWDGEIGCATFPVQVPDDAHEGPHEGTASILVNGFSVMRIDFTLQIAPKQGLMEALPAQESRYRTAFVSYARWDVLRVGARLQGIRKAVPDLEIFWDFISLRSGQRWEVEIKNAIDRCDVFYLFWSRAAKRSVEVGKEWRYALRTKGLNCIDPIPLVSPTVVPPPPELAALHFDDSVLAFSRYPHTLGPRFLLAALRQIGFRRKSGPDV